MSLDWLRKRIKEKIANGTLGTSYTAPEIPGMDNLNQPAAPNPVDTYNPPEVDVPTAQTPKTTPISVPTTNTAKNTSVSPKNSTTGNNKKVVPKTGQAGAKALDNILKDDKRFFKMTMNERLAEAYNAGYYGMDISRDVRDDAAAGDYLDSIEAMYNAGKQDSKGSSTTDESEKSNNDLSTEAAREEQLSLNSNRNTADINYTPSNNIKNAGTVGSSKEMKINSNKVPRMGDKENSNVVKITQQENGKNLIKNISASLKDSSDYKIIDPRIGQSGYKVWDDFDKNYDLNNKSDILKILTKVYNAGLNNMDLSEDIEKLALDGGYLDYINEMYKSGLQDRLSFIDIYKRTAANPNIPNQTVMPANGEPWRYDYPNYRVSGKPHEGRDLTGDDAVAIGNMVVVGTYPYNKATGTNTLDNGWGNCVIFSMEYMGEIYLVAYAHLDSLPELQPGQLVKAGEVVGKIGESGHSIGGPHFHISVMEEGLFEGVTDEVYIDPLTLFGKSPEKKYSPVTDDINKELVAGTVYGYNNVYTNFRNMLGGWPLPKKKSNNRFTMRGKVK